MELLLKRKTVDELKRRYPYLSTEDAVNKAIEDAFDDRIAVERAAERAENRREFKWALIALVIVSFFGWLAVRT